MATMRAAEVIDAYRIVPRILVILWILAVGLALGWYMEFPNIPLITCDERMFSAAMQAGATLQQAELFSCRQTGVIDRPTGYTALMAVLIGASTGVFGFYVNSGRNWLNDK